MKLRNFILIFYIYLLISSCHQDGIIEDIVDIDNNEVNFTTEEKSKGDDLTNSNIDNIGVFSFYTGTQNWADASNNTSPNYMYNNRLSREKINNIWSDWHYSPIIYWPKENEKLSFFAYSPFADNVNKIQISDKSQIGLPYINYEIPLDVKKQIDLLYTLPIIDISKNNTSFNSVKLDFKHSLTKIAFNAKLKAGTEPSIDNYVKITSIELTSCLDNGKLSFVETPTINAVWTNRSTKKSYTLKLNNGLKDRSLTSKYENISETDGYLFLLPQNINSDSKIIIKYELYDKSDLPLQQLQKTADLHSIISQFPMGKAVIFNLELGIETPGIINSEIRPWDNINVDGNFAATILNISRTNIQEYQGRTITIYYETDYENYIYMTCIQRPYNQPNIYITPYNGKIIFPNDLKPGDYKFRLKVGGLSQIISLKII